MKEREKRLLENYDDDDAMRWDNRKSRQSYT